MMLSEKIANNIVLAEVLLTEMCFKDNEPSHFSYKFKFSQEVILGVHSKGLMP